MPKRITDPAHAYQMYRTHAGLISVIVLCGSKPGIRREETADSGLKARKLCTTGIQNELLLNRMYGIHGPIPKRRTKE